MYDGEGGASRRASGDAQWYVVGAGGVKRGRMKCREGTGLAAGVRSRPAI